MRHDYNTENITDSYFFISKLPKRAMIEFEIREKKELTAEVHARIVVIEYWSRYKK